MPVSSWHCPFCGEPLADAQQPHCGEAGHAEVDCDHDWKYRVPTQNCICVGIGAGANLTTERNVIEMNFAGIGMRRTVMIDGEIEVMKAVISRMIASES
jgi:hypothetical protein